ncbi:hypothetical protein BKA62DRAFT_689118 [Auriculariales sp. MPI-PUGE-AT-0066]|nr:hypothetical protein BKA62DRAFT_689118 [Auriculariales sp. MPI-PUGE-AT-0066]
MSDAKAAPAPAPESAAPVAADASTAAAGADQTSTTKTTKGKGGAAAKKGAAASTSKAKKAAADKPAAVPTRTRPVREIKKPQEPGVSLAAQPSKAAPKKPTVPVASIKIPKNRKTLPGGTYAGFPFYPGVVVEENDKTIPPKVKSSKPSEAARDKSHLIKFAGAKDKVSWGWIPAALMQAFNESGASDSKIMKSQRYKTKKEQSEVRKWYRSSLAAIEAAGGEAGAKAKAALAAEKDGKLDELDDKMDEDADGEPVSNGDAAIEETA